MLYLYAIYAHVTITETLSLSYFKLLSIIYLLHVVLCQPKFLAAIKLSHKWIILIIFSVLIIFNERKLFNIII